MCPQARQLARGRIEKVDIGGQSCKFSSTTSAPEPCNCGIMSIGTFKKLKRPFRSRWPVIRRVRDDDGTTYTSKMFPRNICRQHFALAFNLNAFHLQSRMASL